MGLEVDAAAPLDFQPSWPQSTSLNGSIPTFISNCFAFFAPEWAMTMSDLALTVLTQCEVILIFLVRIFQLLPIFPFFYTITFDGDSPSYRLDW